MIYGHPALLPDRRRRRATSTVAETRSPRRVWVRVDAVRAGPGARTASTQPAFAVGVSSGAVSVCGAGQERQSPDHGILIMRELVAWSFMYSLDGLLAGEGTAY